MEGTQKITPKFASEKITETEILQTCQNYKKAHLKENTAECRNEIETIEMEPNKRRKQLESKESINKRRKQFTVKTQITFLMYLKQRKKPFTCPTTK